MASTDARPVPIKNTAHRVTFPILDNTGALVTGAAGLDSEVSKDAGTFTDCTNEATEIATSSGMYYLDLTATEMNADTVAIIVKTSTTDAKTTPIVLYPQESGDIKVDLQSISGSAVSTSSAQLGVNVVNVGGTSQTGSDLASDIANIPSDYLDMTNGIETGITPKQAQRAILAFVSGKADGGGSTPVNFRDPGDSVNRIAMTVDSNGNRSAVTLNL